jgi:hypothetical protein
MRAILSTFLVLLISFSSSGEEKDPAMLTHAVFFELKENDAKSIQELVDGCYKYLAPHDGIVFFSAGPRHTDYKRDVNDVTFDVALTVVFESIEAQDAYQVTEPHKKFIKEFSNNWTSVRVFDSQATTR